MSRRRRRRPAAAVVQGDARRGHGPARVSEDHGGAPAAVSRVAARADAGAARPFQLCDGGLSQPLWVLFAATARAAGARLPECGRSLPGARIRARSRDQDAARAGRVARTDRTAAAGRQRAGGARRGRSRRGARAARDADPDRVSAARYCRQLPCTPTIDTRLLVFAFAVSVAAGLLSGLAPAVQAGRGSLISSLRERDGSGGVRLRKAIVTAQIAFSLVLVIGAAAVCAHTHGTAGKRPWFDTTSLIAFGIDPPQNGYAPPRREPIGVAASMTRYAPSPTTTASAVCTLPAAHRRILEQPDDDSGRSTDRHRSGGQYERGHSRAFFRRSAPESSSGGTSIAGTLEPATTGGRASAIVNEAFVARYLAGPQSARRADRRGLGARRPAGP